MNTAFQLVVAYSSVPAGSGTEPVAADLPLSAIPPCRNEQPAHHFALLTAPVLLPNLPAIAKDLNALKAGLQHPVAMSKGTRFLRLAIPAFILYVLAFFQILPTPFLSAESADAILPVVSSQL